MTFEGPARGSVFKAQVVPARLGGRATLWPFNELWMLSSDVASCQAAQLGSVRSHPNFPSQSLPFIHSFQ